MPASRKADRAMPAAALREAIESFLIAARRPAILDPGLKPIELDGSNFVLTERADGLLIEAWDRDQTLTRRVVQLKERLKERLLFDSVRFGGGKGRLELSDLDAPRGKAALSRSGRDELASQLRVWLARQMPGWRVAELTTGPDLEHTLSPAFPRAFLAKGEYGWAALASPSNLESASEALTFGLIWLDYLRRREIPRPVGGLLLFVPVGSENGTLLRMRFLDADRCKVVLVRYDASGWESPVDEHDTGNVDTRLEPWPTATPSGSEETTRRLARLADVETIQRRNSEVSYRVKGLEFARWTAGGLAAGVLRGRRKASIEAAERLAGQLAGLRTAEPADPHHAWCRAKPEAWLESMVLANVQAIDAGFRPEPVYSQVPGLSGTEHGRIDVLALERSGRLAVLELKAVEDPHLPLQALDYWIRAAHHLAAGDFEESGYFRGHPVLRRTPKIYLVAPAMRFHPTTETILSYLASVVEVERVGLGVEWQRRLRVVMRASGALAPGWQEDPPDVLTARQTDTESYP